MEPETLEDALKCLDREHEACRVVAGGTGMALILREGLYKPDLLICLKKLKKELSHIRVLPEGGMFLGSLTTLREMELSPLLGDRYPVMRQALKRLANPRVRNQATVGGHLAYADAHLDLPPIFMALGAQMKATSTEGTRSIPAADFFQGYYVTALKENEILTEIFLPPMDEAFKGVYLKYCSAATDDWPTAGITVLLAAEGMKVTDIRMVASAATETPQRLAEAEEILRSQKITPELIVKAGLAAEQAVEPIEDLRGSSWYKKKMIGAHVKKALQELMGW